jgi:ADP-ribosylglycohydrolase
MTSVNLNPDRVTGSVLGAAVGDALGHPVEFISSMSAIRQKFGPEGVTGYALFWEEGGRRFAPYTDDTQMAEVVLRSLLDSREAGECLAPAMRRIGRGFADWERAPQGGHRAPGTACLRGARELAGGRAWDAADPEAGGCGSVMRAYPFGLVFAEDEERAEAWAVSHSRLTHGHPMAVAACAGMAVGIARAVKGAPPAGILDAMVDASGRYDETTAALCRDALTKARGGWKPEQVLELLLGWNAREAIAAAVYVFARHPNEPRVALLEAANTPGDSDSIATLVGALVGARKGLGGLPAGWIAELERTDELQALARRVTGVAVPAARL